MPTASSSSLRLDTDLLVETTSAINIPKNGSEFLILDSFESTSTLRPNLSSVYSYSSSCSSDSRASRFSFSSATSIASSPTACSASPDTPSSCHSAYKHRPSLTPDDLYVHAFGLEALEKQKQRQKRLSENDRVLRAPSEDLSNLRRSSSSSSLSRISISRTFSASPPPTGTFKSVTKRSRPCLVSVYDHELYCTSSPSPLASANGPSSGDRTPPLSPSRSRSHGTINDSNETQLGQGQDDSTDNGKGLRSRAPMQDFNIRSGVRSPSRQLDPLMSNEDWRKKSAGRLKRRAMLRAPLNEAGAFPLTIEEDKDEFVVFPQTPRCGGSDRRLCAA